MIPGSALRKLEAITGLKATKEADKCYALWIEEGVAYFAMVADEQDACKQLRDDNWRRVCNTVFREQEFKCARCGQIQPLQGHHKLYRSRWSRKDGPLDVASNTEGLCARCHESEHRSGFGV